MSFIILQDYVNFLSYANCTDNEFAYCNKKTTNICVYEIFTLLLHPLIKISRL